MARVDEENSEKVKLQKKDVKILALLDKDARATYKQLGKVSYTSRDTAAYRVKRLEKEGVIDRYTLDFNFRKYGYEEHHILFQLLESDPDKTEDFKQYLISQSQVTNIITYTDKWDMKITSMTEDAIELDKFLTSLSNKFSDIIIDYEIMERVKTFHPVFQDSDEELKLDEVDKKLLRMLSKDSRTSAVDLANQLEVSADTVIYRMKKYVELGLIHQFTVHMNVNKMGYHWYDMLVLMKKFTEKEEAMIREIARDNDNIISAIKTIGEWNMIITVLAKNPPEFHSIATHIRRLLKDTLKDYDALLAYKELKNDFSQLI